MNKKSIIASSHLDRHNHRIMPSALEQMRDIINGEKAVQLSFEHNTTMPPLGQIKNAETYIADDGETMLIVEQSYFDESFIIQSEEGEDLYVERLKEGGRPFNSIEYEELGSIEVSVDITNLGNQPDSVEKFKNSIESEVDYDFDLSEFGRKSEIPDPQILIKLTPEIVAYLLGLTFLFKFSEKLGEKFGELSSNDISKFYKFVSVTARKTAAVVIPKLRPVTYVIQILGEINIELVIVTRNPDDVAKAIQKDSLRSVSDKIKSLMKLADAQKIQFLFNEKGEWEFNYMLTGNGEVIGTPKAFDNRTKFINSTISSARLENPE
ncbi:hypothetical protein WBJ53_19655 [Spirosoma sp. SC4-14]|uniref:hypothetical protein n=1 Tax=Spirosoma sp. SC4-14 TaxID=3128900 RepID=UPI0030D62E5F